MKFHFFCLPSVDSSIGGLIGEEDEINISLPIKRIAVLSAADDDDNKRKIRRRSNVYSIKSFRSFEAVKREEKEKKWFSTPL